jgi:hypothetical protein
MNRINIKDLESVIKKYKISKPKYRNEDIENTSIPSMLTVFREMIKDGIPPKQDEFINEFGARNPNLKMRGLTSKLKRAYLSFVREYHLEYLLRRHFRRVIYSEEADIAGIDYIIYYKKRKFNIHAFVDTSSGRYWREIKNGRHKFRGIHLDLPMDLSAGKRVGNFILYTDNHVLKLKSEMEKVILDKSKLKVNKSILNTKESILRVIKN